MIRGHSLICLVVAAIVLVGCTDPTIDSSSDEAAKQSAQQIRESLPAEDRERFDKALFTVTMNAAVGDKSLMEIAASDPDQLRAKALERLDGKSAEDIFRMADEIRAERREQERLQAVAEIAELEELQQAAMAATAGLSEFKVLRSRYYKQPQRYGRPEPVIELSVSNGTGKAVSRAYFKGVVASPGRSVPWIAEDFNYEIPGGIEPGETAEWSLAPNMFSEWGRETPEDAVLTVTVVRVDGADGEPLFDSGAFSPDMAVRLQKLKESYSLE
jgi:hypothetical protein